jgi:hypothetical protein
MVAPSKNEVLHNGGRRKNEYKSTKMSVGTLFPVGWPTRSASLCHGGVAKLLLSFNVGASVCAKHGGVANSCCFQRGGAN